MVFFPLSILALAAGVYLLIKVKREYLGGAFEVLSWLIIFLSIVSISFGGFKAVSRSMHKEGKTQCHQYQYQHKQPGKPDHFMNNGGGHECHHAAGCVIEGDSIVMDETTCTSIMGKAACAAMRRERGRCIVSKDECTRMCDTSGKSCCIKDKTTSENNSKTCCKKQI